MTERRNKMKLSKMSERRIGKEGNCEYQVSMFLPFRTLC